MPCASRRSVFTSEALSAARTCRVSMRTVSRSCRDRPACNHSDIGPASSPTRSGACAARAAATRSGSVDTEPSNTTWPCSSTQRSPSSTARRPTLRSASSRSSFPSDQPAQLVSLPGTEPDDRISKNRVFGRIEAVSGLMAARCGWESGGSSCRSRGLRPSGEVRPVAGAVRATRAGACWSPGWRVRAWSWRGPGRPCG